MNLVTFENFYLQKKIVTSNLIINNDQTNIFFINNVQSLVNLSGIYNRTANGNIYIKSLVSSNLNMTSDDTNIYIIGPASQTVSTTSVGIQSYVLFNNENNVLTFKSFIGGSYINIVDNTNDLYINNASPHQTLVLSAGGDIVIDYTNINQINIGKNVSVDILDFEKFYAGSTLTTSYTPQIIHGWGFADQYRPIWSVNFTTMVGFEADFTAIHYIGDSTRYFRVTVGFPNKNVPNNRTVTNAIAINGVIQVESVVVQNGTSTNFDSNIFKLKKNDYLSIYMKANSAFTIGSNKLRFSSHSL